MQDIFSAILEQSGKQGYASAEPVGTDVDLAAGAEVAWDNWYQEFSAGRYSFDADASNPSVQAGKTSEQLRDDYKAILSDTYAKGGYVNAQSYLSSLSADQLRTIQQVHHLAGRIEPSSLSEESSLNLLLPPDAQVDLNRDGFTSVGAANKICFPNSNTPKDVSEAWEAATAGLSSEEKMMYELQMMMPVTLANLHIDSNGQFAGSSQPGDANWSNPMADDYSYADAANNLLSYLDRFKTQMPTDRYLHDKAFWSSFRDQLNNT